MRCSIVGKSYSKYSTAIGCLLGASLSITNLLCIIAGD
jgi:hypothetical protein